MDKLTTEQICHVSDQYEKIEWVKWDDLMAHIEKGILLEVEKQEKFDSVRRSEIKALKSRIDALREALKDYHLCEFIERGKGPCMGCLALKADDEAAIQ